MVFNIFYNIDKYKPSEYLLDFSRLIFLVIKCIKNKWFAV